MTDEAWELAATPEAEQAGGVRENEERNEAGAKPGVKESLEAITADWELYWTRDGRYFAKTRIGGKEWNFDLNGGNAVDYLIYAHDMRAGETLSPREARNHLRLLKARARFETEPVELPLRVAETGGKVYYDLADGTGGAVGIGPEGWGRIKGSPVRFF